MPEPFDWEILQRPSAMAMVRGQLGFSWMVLSGRLGIAMDDGETGEFGPGEVAEIPPGHDAWCVGDAPCELIDMFGNVMHPKDLNPGLDREAGARERAWQTRARFRAGRFAEEGFSRNPKQYWPS